MSYRIVLVFDTADEAAQALEFIGDPDAPVFLGEDDRSYVGDDVDDRQFPLWREGADALAYLKQIEEE